MAEKSSFMTLSTEVLCYIFKRVEDGEKSRTHTLLQLALTCKETSSIALDLLWCEGNLFFALLKTGLPLIRYREEGDTCDPRDIHWVFGLDEKKISSLSSEGIPQGVRWDRLTLYSERIRHLRIMSDSVFPLPVVKNNVFQLLERCIRSQKSSSCLFPNLQSLSIEAEGGENAFLSHLAIFPGPRLTHVALLGCQSPQYIDNDDTDYLSGFLYAMKALSPRLEELLFYLSKPFDLRIAYTTALTAGDFSRLTSLYTGDISLHAFVHIGYMVNLTKLIARQGEETSNKHEIMNFVDSIKQHVEMYGRTFRKLEVCHLFGFPLTATISILDSMTPSTALSSVNLEPYNENRPSTNHTDAMCLHERESFLKVRGAVLSTCSPGSALLTQVVISGSDRKLAQIRVEPDVALPRDALEPFLAFPNLKLFKIDSPLLNIDDSFLERVSKAWPKLQTIYLGSESGISLLSAVTLRSLVPLLHGCPDLKDIGLIFDGDAGILPSAEAPEHLRRTIHTLHVGNSKAPELVDDTGSSASKGKRRLAKRKTIAKFLAQLFINIGRTVAWNNDPVRPWSRTVNEGWKSVFGLLPQLGVRCGETYQYAGGLIAPHKSRGRYLDGEPGPIPGVPFPAEVSMGGGMLMVASFMGRDEEAEEA